MKAALIGAGQIARQHLACLQRIPGVEVAGGLRPLAVGGGVRGGAVRRRAPGSPTTAACWPRSAPTSSTSPRPRPRTHLGDGLPSTPAPTSSWRSRPPPPSTSSRRSRAAPRQAGGAWSRTTTTSSTARPLEILRRIDAGRIRRGGPRRGDDLPRHPRPEPDSPTRTSPTPPSGWRAEPSPTSCPTSPRSPTASSGRTGAVTPSGPSGARPSLPYDEFRAVVEAERGTATLASAPASQPDGFWLRVYGERMLGHRQPLRDARLTFDRLRPGPKPLRPFLNGLEEGKAIARAAVARSCASSGAARGAYEGLFELLGRHLPLRSADGSAPPVTSPQVLEVNRLVEALKPLTRRGQRVKVLVTGAERIPWAAMWWPRLLPGGRVSRAMVRPAATRRGPGLAGASVEVFAPTCAARAISSAPSKAWTCSCTWRRRSPGARTASSPRRWSAPSGSSAPWRGPAAGAWCWPAASRSTTGAPSAAPSTRTRRSSPSRPLRARRLLHRQVLAGARHSPASRAARLGAHGAAAGLHLGAGPRATWRRSACRSARLHLVIGPLSRMPMTHVENCANLFALAATDPRAGGQTFNVVDGPGERIWSFLGDLPPGQRRAAASGSPSPTRLALAAVRLAFATVFRRNLKLPHILIPCASSRGSSRCATPTGAPEVLGWSRRSSTRSASAALSHPRGRRGPRREHGLARA